MFRSGIQPFIASVAVLVCVFAIPATTAVQFLRKRPQLDMQLTLEYEISHERRVTALAFSPDGRQLATSAGGRLIRIWDAQTGKEAKRLNGPGEPLAGDFSIGLNAYSLAFSPNGTILAAAGDVVSATGLRTGTEVDLWDLPSGRMGSMTTSKAPDAKYSQSVVFAPDGRTLFVALHSYVPGRTSGEHHAIAEVQEWDVTTTTFQKTWNRFDDDFRLSSLAISPDGKTFAIGYSKDMARIGFWNIETGELQRQFETFFGTFSLSFSPDGKKLASCQDPRAAGGGMLRGIVICDVQAGYLGTIPTDQAPPVTATAFSPDGVHLATGNMGYPGLLGTGPAYEGSTVKMWRIR